MRDEDYNRIILPAFYDKEDITGTVQILLNSKSLDHSGIKIMFVGIIERADNPKKFSEFITLSKVLSPPGTLTSQLNQIRFTFSNVEKNYESYRGIYINVRYVLRVMISFSLRTLTYEREIGVVLPHTRDILQLGNPPIRMDVGIGKWLKLTLEIDQSKFGTKDVVNGRVKFRVASVKLKQMVLQIIRKETIIGDIVDRAILCRYEIMDGAPANNEVIPFRFFLSPYELTPTYMDINHKFSVQYILNLVLIDDKEERYFKQHEIVLYRIPRFYDVDLK